MNWVREELIWLAGFYEGEGSVTLTNLKHRTQYLFSITSCDKDVLERVKNIIGYGNFMGPYKRENRNNKPYWQYQIGKKEHVLALLWVIYPWLGERRKAKVRELSIDFRILRVDGRAKGGKAGVIKMQENRMLRQLAERWDCTLEEAQKRLDGN